MTTENSTEKTLAIREIAKLASEAELAIDFDFEKIGVSKEDMYSGMAKSVFDQLDGLPEQQRAGVAMASMTKLLVENFCLGATLKMHLTKNDTNDTATTV
jgi:hypothetical protein